MTEKISFNEIKSLFPAEHWDVGYLSAETFKRVALTPIKAKFHYEGDDFTNGIYFRGLTNTIVLIRVGSVFDYSHYDEAKKILENSKFTNYRQFYTNFKEAAIHAGLGVRARNSLLFSYKFGFDCHICAFGFFDEIVDVPQNKRVNHKLWSRCTNCLDCVKACPVGAIHGEKEPYWLDSMKCDEFIGLSSHPTIPSIKKFWHDHVYPEIPQDLVDKSTTHEDRLKYLGLDHFPWNKNGYTFDGQVTRKDGVAVDVPVCRECTSQPRCSQWGGKYPYDDPSSTKKIFWLRKGNGSKE